jgi:hypothetical protein
LFSGAAGRISGGATIFNRMGVIWSIVGVFNIVCGYV